MQSQDKPQLKSSSSIVISGAVILSAIMLTVWCGAWFIARKFFIVSPSLSYGDFFSAINALFAGLAFIGVICTILLQRVELEQQRQDLKETQLEYEKQRFEDTFFRMISLHNDILNSMEILYSADGNVKGRGCFKIIFERLRTQLWADSLYPPDTEAKWLETIANKYLPVFETYQSELGHYFRNLYTIVKFIDDAPNIAPKTYIRILRSQLSRYEFLLVFYNGLTMGSEKFKPLIEKYALFNNFPEADLLHKDHKNLYKPGAFSAIPLS